MTNRWDAETIDALRIRAGLSMEEFARRVGTTTGTVWRWVRGRQEPKVMARKLLEQFEVELGRTEETDDRKTAVA